MKDKNKMTVRLDIMVNIHLQNYSQRMKTAAKSSCVCFKRTVFLQLIVSFGLRSCLLKIKRKSKLRKQSIVLDYFVIDTILTALHYMFVELPYHAYDLYSMIK